MCWKTLSGISNIDRHATSVLYDSNVCFRTCGVAVDVGQTFLDDTESRQFAFLRKSDELIRQCECCLDIAALSEASHIAIERRHEPSLFKQRRMQQMGYGSSLFHRLSNQLFHIIEGR